MNQEPKNKDKIFFTSPEIITAIDEVLKNGGAWMNLASAEDKPQIYFLSLPLTDPRVQWCAQYFEHKPNHYVPHWIVRQHERQ